MESETAKALRYCTVSTHFRRKSPKGNYVLKKTYFHFKLFLFPISLKRLCMSYYLPGYTFWAVERVTDYNC